MQINVARRPRFKRVSNFPNIQLTQRDEVILSAVSRYRFLTTSHILSLVPGSRQNIIRRLQRLYHAGFLERPRAQLPLRFAGEISEMVYSPPHKTATSPAIPGGRTGSGRKHQATSSLFLFHALAVSDVIISIQAVCHLRGMKFISEQDILNFLRITNPSKRLNWRVVLKIGSTAEKIAVIPDATFAIEKQDSSGKPRRRHFFLEVDRGTMPLYRKSLRLSSIRRKAFAYARSRRTKALRERFDIPGFQVLFITRSKDRLERMKKTCEAVTGGHDSSIFLFAAEQDLKEGAALTVLGMV